MEASDVLIMLGLIVACLLSQTIEVRPPRPEVGTDVGVVVRDANLQAVPGVIVRLGRSAADERDLGVTDSAGALTFAPSSAGPHRLAARMGSLTVYAPVYFSPGSNRLLWGIACGAIGAGLLWRHRRWLKSGGDGARP